MTMQNTPDSSPVAAAPGPSLTASSSWSWRRGALVLSVAAQLITISALTSADPLAVSWSPLLLAIAPAPLAAVAVFAPVRVARLAGALLGLVVLGAGMAGGIGRVGVFFVPALVVLAVAAVKLWRERP